MTCESESEYWFLVDNRHIQGMGKTRAKAALDYIRMGGVTDGRSLDHCRPLVGGEEIKVTRPRGCGSPDRETQFDRYGHAHDDGNTSIVFRKRLAPPRDLYWWQIWRRFEQWNLLSSVRREIALERFDEQLFPLPEERVAEIRRSRIESFLAATASVYLMPERQVFLEIDPLPWSVGSQTHDRLLSDEQESFHRRSRLVEKLCEPLQVHTPPILLRQMARRAYQFRLKHPEATEASYEQLFGET